MQAGEREWELGRRARVGEKEKSYTEGAKKGLGSRRKGAGWRKVRELGEGERAGQ